MGTNGLMSLSNTTGILALLSRGDSTSNRPCIIWHLAVSDWMNFNLTRRAHPLVKRASMLFCANINNDFLILLVIVEQGLDKSRVTLRIV